MRVVDLGSGASGFQFALADRGVEVVSVDPLLSPAGMRKKDWSFTEANLRRLNRAFGGKVRFVRAFLEEARLDSAAFDRVFSISVFEHIPPEAIQTTVRQVHRILKPGGLLVLTLDLFLDCWPFTRKQENVYGSNIQAPAFLDDGRFTLVVGRREELCGFAEFDPQAILARREEFLVVNDVLTQCMVLQKATA